MRGPWVKDPGCIQLWQILLAENGLLFVLNKNLCENRKNKNKIKFIYYNLSCTHILLYNLYYTYKICRKRGHIEFNNKYFNIISLIILH